MKHFRFFITLILITTIVFSFYSCSSDDEDNNPKLNYETYITAEIKEVIDNLQFTIHHGDNPPNVEGKYFSDKITVPKSNIPGDLMPSRGVIGAMTYNLFDQKNNRSISSVLKLDYNSSLPYTAEEYSGTGTLITGTDNKFTIYSIYDGILHVGGKEAKAKLLYLISAEIVKNDEGKNTALANVSSVLLMLDNYGDPYKTLIKNGQARKFASQVNAGIVTN